MTGVIILAAGGSSRLGFAKQTLLYKGKTLLEIAIEAALSSKCGPVTVILGANADTIEPGIKHYAIDIIHNTKWSEGMASSIKLGVEHFLPNTNIDSIMIMLCDQPYVSRTVLRSLLYKQQETGKKIVASTYSDTVGVPALFSRSIFNDLLLLQGQEGAKKIITRHPDETAVVSFENGIIDVDTVADYEALLKRT